VRGCARSEGKLDEPKPQKLFIQGFYLRFENFPARNQNGGGATLKSESRRERTPPK
jgi:hypothetical protein